MTIKTISAAVLVASLIAGPALAGTTYYGTSRNVAQSNEQNNAQVGPVSAQRADRATDGFAARQTFGTPRSSASNDTARDTDANGFVGTAWRGQDTADQITR